MRPRERPDADGDGGDEAGCSGSDANTSSANASTSSSTAASSSGVRRSGSAAAGTRTRRSIPMSTPTINLSQEYTLAIHTSSYKEIWTKIHVDGDGRREEGGRRGEGEEEEQQDRVTLAVVLRPEDAEVERALGDAPPDAELTRLAADYFRGTRQASLLCLSLHRALRRARALYGPVADVLALVPHDAPRLAAPHRDCAFDAFLLFDQTPNPFPAPAVGFQGVRRSFHGLKDHLRLLKVRRRRQRLRCATRGSGICILACAAGAAVAGILLATHTVTALLAAAPACAASGSSCCPLVSSIERLQKHMDRLDATARGTYVLNNDVDTIERLVGRLHATVESDKMLVRLGLERGRGQHHTIEEVVRQLRKNHPSLLRQLADLEEHICIYFAAVNRARSLLVDHLDALSDPEMELPFS